MLIVDVVDCVYSLPKKQVGWVNGNPYYGDFHVHPSTGVKMVGHVHVSTPHATIYNTKEESLGLSAPVTYTPQNKAAIEQSTLPESNVSDTTITSEINTSDTPSMDQTQQTPQQPTQQSNPTPPTDNTDTTGSSGSSGAEDPAAVVVWRRILMSTKTYNNPPQNFILQINKDLELHLELL